MGVTKLGHRTDIAGVQFADLGPFPALLDGQVVQLFRDLVVGIPDFGAALQRPGEESEQRHVADVRFRGGLEDTAQQR